MSNKLFEKKNIKILVICLEIIFLAAICSLAIFTYRSSRPVAFKTSGMTVVSNDQSHGVDFKFDGIEKSTDGGKEYITVKGWVLQQGVESKTSDTIKVVLMDINTGRCYSIPTERTSKKSLTRQYYDGTTYDDSGFEGKIRLCNEINSSSEYQVLIYLKNSEGKKLVDTQTGVFGWINAHA